MEPKNFGRICLYHTDCSKGKIFTEETEFWQAIKDGWVDSPNEIENPDYKVTAYGDPPSEKKPWQKALEARKAKRAKASEDLQEEI